MTGLWENRSLKRKIEGLRLGIPVSIAFVGSFAFGPIGGLGGFLTGLGFSIGSKILNVKREDLSKRIARLVSPGYQVNVYARAIPFSLTTLYSASNEKRTRALSYQIEMRAHRQSVIVVT